jgi:hypothetical protein
MRECRGCRSAFDERFRFCPWCGAAQRLKIVEYFTGLPVAPGDEGKGLRVSRYLTAPGHVRFSVWSVGRVDAAVSIDEEEARRLAAFLRGTDAGLARPRFAERLFADRLKLRRARSHSGCRPEPPSARSRG